MKHNEIERILLEKYKSIFNNQTSPEWAMKNKKTQECIYPSIPFIGKQYSTQDKRILVYASAENLTYYKNSNGDNELLESEIAWNRRRIGFESCNGDFFPFVHIQPIDNGGLLSLTYFIAIYNGWIRPDYNPYQFIECLAVDNIGKFSIDSDGRNVDYIQDKNKLLESYNYIEADIKTLKPNVIILPEKALMQPKIKEMIQVHCEGAIIIPIYQLTSTVINCHISKQISQTKYEEVEKLTPDNLKEWVEKIKIRGMKKSGMYLYFAHALDRYKNTKS